MVSPPPKGAQLTVRQTPGKETTKVSSLREDCGNVRFTSSLSIQQKSNPTTRQKLPSIAGGWPSKYRLGRKFFPKRLKKPADRPFPRKSSPRPSALPAPRQRPLPHGRHWGSGALGGPGRNFEASPVPKARTR